MVQTRSSGGNVPSSRAAAAKLRAVGATGSAPSEAPSPQQISPAPGRAGAPSPASVHRPGYVVPLVHMRLPEPAVTVGFFGALVAAAAVGLVDVPVAVLAGAAVVIAHHHRS